MSMMSMNSVLDALASLGVTLLGEKMSVEVSEESVEIWYITW